MAQLCTSACTLRRPLGTLSAELRVVINTPSDHENRIRLTKPRNTPDTPRKVDFMVYGRVPEYYPLLVFSQHQLHW